jgi:cytochrome c55X
MRNLLPLLVLLLTAPALAAEPTAEPDAARQHALRYMVRQDCGSCHGMTLKGGLGPSLLPEALAEKDSEGLVAIVLRGVPGTPMPPWDVELSPAEAAWLVELLKTGVGP